MMQHLKNVGVSQLFLRYRIWTFYFPKKNYCLEIPCNLLYFFMFLNNSFIDMCYGRKTVLKYRKTASRYDFLIF